MIFYYFMARLRQLSYIHIFYKTKTKTCLINCHVLGVQICFFLHLRLGAHFGMLDSAAKKQEASSKEGSSQGEGRQQGEGRGMHGAGKAGRQAIAREQQAANREEEAAVISPYWEGDNYWNSLNV